MFRIIKNISKGNFIRSQYINYKVPNVLTVGKNEQCNTFQLG